MEVTMLQMQEHPSRDHVLRRIRQTEINHHMARDTSSSNTSSSTALYTTVPPPGLGLGLHRHHTVAVAVPVVVLVVVLVATFKFKVLTLEATTIEAASESSERRAQPTADAVPPRATSCPKTLAPPLCSPSP
jgi:hypothetical protein